MIDLASARTHDLPKRGARRRTDRRRQVRIQHVSDGVVATYIRDMSSRAAPRRAVGEITPLAR